MSDAPAENVDDIRADVLAAMSQTALAETTTQPDPTPAPEPGKEAQADPVAKLGEPARAPDGKFAAKTETTPTPEKAPETPAPAAPTAKAPDQWTAAMKEEYGKLPPSVQAYISEREATTNRKILSQDEDRALGKQVREAAAPFQATFLQEGATVPQAFQQFLTTAQILRGNNPQLKAQALHNIARQFNVDLSVPHQPGASQDQLGIHPSQVQQLVQAELQTWHQRQEQSSLKTEIDAFASAPGHEHYETVKPIMASLLTSGAATSLQDAYDQALWANPETRTSLQATQSQATEQKRIADAQARADAAKRASGSVTGAPGGAVKPNGAVQDRSLEDEIRANYHAAAGGRM